MKSEALNGTTDKTTIEAQGEHSSSLYQSNRFIMDPLLINAQVYIIEEKYEISYLKEVGAKKYAKAAVSLWNSSEFSESVELLWENTMEEDRMLKEIIPDVASKNLSTLLYRDEFKDLLSSHGNIAVDVLTRVMHRPPTMVEEFADPWDFVLPVSSKDATVTRGGNRSGLIHLP